MTHSTDGFGARLPLQDVEQLVLRFLQPGNPLEVQQLDRRIRELQRSFQGWEIADYLLGRSEPTVRFFGANTFQAKLNNEWENLDAADLAAVGGKLVKWIVTLLDAGEGKLVLQKLSSTLAVYYMLPTEVAAYKCVRTLLASYSSKGLPVSDAVDALDPSSVIALIQSLNCKQLILSLWFSKSLVEEATYKITGYASEIISNTLSRMKANLPDIVELIRHCLVIGTGNAVNSEDLSRIRSEALSCLLSSALFVQSAWSRDDQALAPLRTLIEPAISWCAIGKSDETMDVLSDLLSNFGTFFQKRHLDMISSLLTSPWGDEQLQIFITEADEELSSFAKLILSFGDVTVKSLAMSPDSPVTQKFMEMMHATLKCPGHAAIDDKAAVQALEFWNSFVEFLVDEDTEDSDGPVPSWIPSARAHVVILSREIWAKIRFPPNTEYSLVDSDKKKEFRQFRAEATDVLEALPYTFKGVVMMNIVQQCIDSLDQKDWLGVEASLFCLKGMAVAEAQVNDNLLASLFGSPLYTELAKPDTAIPARTCHTAVGLLGQCANFFERHSQYLPATLEFLFSSLQNAALTQEAARSIFSLCSSCRSSLSPQLPNFVQGYSRLLTWTTAGVSTKENVIGGIAAIIQALRSNDEQTRWLYTLLDFVQADVQAAGQQFANGNTEEGQVAAHTALRCLLRVGKAMQASQDLPINLELDTEVWSYWSDGPGKAVQDRICQILEAMMQFLPDPRQRILELQGDILEDICSLFKAGFGEATPGPFVLPAGVIVSFISTVHLYTPRLDAVLATACAFLRSHSTANAPRIDVEASNLLRHLVTIIRSLQSPRDEAEVSSGLIEVLTRYMPRYVNVLLESASEDLELLFGFPLICLEIPEPLPKRAAATFWTNFLTIRSGSTTVSQLKIDYVFQHFGPKLALSFIDQVAGSAARSDLDWFAEPLKAFATRHVYARGWLEQALSNGEVASRVDKATRSRFFLQLVMPNTSLAVMKRNIAAFWKQCKGLTGVYAP